MEETFMAAHEAACPTPAWLKVTTYSTFKKIDIYGR